MYVVIYFVLDCVYSRLDILFVLWILTQAKLGVGADSGDC